MRKKKTGPLAKATNIQLLKKIIPQKFPVRIYLLLLIFLGLALYMKSLTNDFVGDDSLQILRNTNVHSLKNIPSFFAGSTYENAGGDSIAGIFYRPLMMSLFTLMYFVSGPHPLLFHFVQLLLHIANAILVFIFLRKFFRNPLSFLVSLIFLVHPINAEAVLYIANLQEVLFFFFGMSALLVMERWKHSNKKIFIISVLLLLSLFSKESGVLFLGIVLLYALFFKNDKKQKASLLIALPLTVGVYVFFRYFLAHMQHANYSLAPITNAPIALRLISIPSIITFYLRMFFYPVNMSIDQFWMVREISQRTFWIPLLIDTGFFLLLMLCYIWVRRRGKENAKLYLFFCAWFIMGLLLHLQLIPLDATVADRWFYFPFLGLLVVLIAIGRNIVRQGKLFRHVTLVGIVIIVCTLSIRTFVRTGDWKSELRLYSTYTDSESNFILDNAYATALIKDDQFAKAKPLVLRSIKEYPYSSNLNNLAIIYTAQNEREKAKETFGKAIAAGQNFSVYENYANFLLYYYSVTEALDFSRSAVSIFPSSPRLWLTYAQSAYLTGNKVEALKASTTSYRLEPSEDALDTFTTINANKPLSLKR